MAANKDDITKAIVTIKVFGVGGGGNNVLIRMAEEGFLDIELIAVNTDAKQLAADKKAGITTIQIGNSLTKGLGTGGRVDIGEAAAISDMDALKEAMSGADLVFITSTMGGGVGTGASSVIASLAKEMNILSVGVVTTPFAFEGPRKKRIAQTGIAKMQSNLDALIVVENDNLMRLENMKNMTFISAFKHADAVLRQAVMCIAELILTTGVINVDFADMTTVFRQSDSSDALLGIGESTNGAIDAVCKAIASPLVSRSIAGARGIILNISGGPKLSLFDVNEATQHLLEITNQANNPEFNLILGSVIDDKLGDTVRAMVIATDFADSLALKAPRIEPMASQPRPPVEQLGLAASAPEEQPKAEASQKPAAGFQMPTFTMPNFGNRGK